MLTVATPVLLLLHIPPVVVVASAEVLLPHTVVIPVMAATGVGDGLTVTVTFCVLEHPLTDKTNT